MSIIENGHIIGSIRLKEAYGVFAFGPDDVEFRTGSLSGSACVISDPERRGLLGSVIERLLAVEEAKRRPWNDAEVELLEEVIPRLQEAGIIEADAMLQDAKAGTGPSTPLIRKPLSDARITIVGHGVLGAAIRRHLREASCGSITVIESSSVAGCGPTTQAGASRRSLASGAAPMIADQPLSRPRDAGQWRKAVQGNDWVVAAQDCFEPEELAAINKAALQCSVPWSLVCFDGYEGWLGPTFIPGQTACFGCFHKRLYAAAAEPKHIFADPGVKVHKVPSPWSVGPESGPWVALLTSMFALDLIAAMQGRSFTLNSILIIHRLNLTFQRESVLRLPRCPECSLRGDGPVPNVFSHILSSYREGR